MIDVETGRQSRVASEVVYGPVKTQHHNWSPDSKWLVYTRNTPTNMQRVFLYSATYSNLRSGSAGTLHYLKSAPSGVRFDGEDGASLYRYDLETRKEELLLDAAEEFALSADGKKTLVGTGSSWVIADASSPIDGGENALDTAAIEVRVDPRAEWAQIFDEAWRISRDFVADPDDVPGGLLGADFDIVDGRYRFKRVYGGLNWNPELRAPLSEPGVAVAEGEFLLAVDGRDLTPPDNLFARFENTAGTIVELTVGPAADGRASRTVDVVPVADEDELRNRAWVEGNLRKVDEASHGRIAYVYVPNTASLGHTYFKRYFFPQADRDAIIIDERYNGGGQVADYYIDMLRRPELCHWAMRYGADIKTPLSSIQGPKAMIIDENAGSGGDLLPWMFRELDLGPLIGRPTWGGLVGVLGFPVLMDGGFVTAPNLGIWTTDGFIVENVGVPPDIEVEQLPAETIAGRDPQLEKAIEVIMAELEADPPTEPVRPPFPVRVRK